MRLTVVLEHRFDRTPDGAVWTADAFARPFWDRFLDVFDTVEVVARVLDVAVVPDLRRRVDGPRVRVLPVPHYIGPVEYVRRHRAVRRTVRDAVDGADAVLLRAPGTLSGLAHERLRQRRKPYGIQVVGDPQDVFQSGAADHPLRAFFRWRFVRALRAECRDAAAAAYVTRETLQRRYPPGPATWATSYSDVELPPEAFADVPNPGKDRPPYTIVTVGSLEQPYKAIDVLLEAVRRLQARGVDVRLRVVGRGRLLGELQALAASLGVSSSVEWVGSLPGPPAVRAELDRADVFALVSRTEGLPRALIEAMARGVPCIGSHAGGIPELLDPPDLVAPDDPAALADLLHAVLSDTARRTAMAQRGLEVARSYTQKELARRRRAFFRRLRDATVAAFPR